eukprot:365289-Chlamydomonas_euryale.AAC.14
MRTGVTGRRDPMHFHGGAGGAKGPCIGDREGSGAWCPTADLFLRRQGLGHRLRRALLREDGTYAPAYLLPDGRLERASRITAPAAAAAASDGGGEVGSFAHTAGIVVVGDELLSGKVGGAAVGESLRRAAVSPSSDAH